jgi:hypothetical protein
VIIKKMPGAKYDEKRKIFLHIFKKVSPKFVIPAGIPKVFTMHYLNHRCD